jgi:two-component system OmpR family sensor kinase
MTQRSIYSQFSRRLILATSLFTILISFMFYGFTKATVYEEITENLVEKAKIIHRASINSLTTHDNLKLIIEDGLTVDLVKSQVKDITFREFYKDNSHYIECNESSPLPVTKGKPVISMISPTS